MAHSEAMARSALRASKPIIVEIGHIPAIGAFSAGFLHTVRRKANKKLRKWATRYLRKRGVK